MLTQAVVAALLSLFGVLLGAGLQHYFSRALESRKQLALQRSQSYVDYFKAVALTAQHGASKDNQAMAADAKVRVCIYGSTQVIRRLHDFDRAGAAITSVESAAIVVELLREMRRDVGMDDSGIDPDAFRAILFGKKFQAV